MRLPGVDQLQQAKLTLEVILLLLLVPLVLYTLARDRREGLIMAMAAR